MIYAVLISENPAPGMLQFTEHPQVYPFCRSVALPKGQQGRNNCPTQTKGTEAAGKVVPVRSRPQKCLVLWTWLCNADFMQRPGSE